MSSFTGLLARVRRRIRRPPPPPSIDPFRVPEEDVATLASAADTDTERLFYGGDHRPVIKWTHYLPVYDAHFARFRGTDVGLLEIGVHHGGSLDLWRSLLGPQARVVGIDLDPECAQYVSAPNVVRIGDQSDPAFLASVVSELGRLDIVIDDGSHFGEHQRASFATLFPLLEPGGRYVIEDLHTSYWPGFNGGLGVRHTGIGLVKELIDDLHGWYYEAPNATGARDWVPALHVYDSIVVIEKAPRTSPRHVQVGHHAPVPS